MKMLAGVARAHRGHDPDQRRGRSRSTIRPPPRPPASASSTRSSTSCRTATSPRTCSSAVSRASARSSTAASMDATPPRCSKRSASRLRAAHAGALASVAQQQVVEIIKARSLNAKILVLDEPTAALADGRGELLFKLVRRLQERGVGDPLHLAPPARGLRAVRPDHGHQGRRAGRHARHGLDQPRELVNLMVGRELDGYFPEARARGLGDVRLDGRGPRDPASCATSTSRSARARSSASPGSGLGPHRDRARRSSAPTRRRGHGRDRRQGPSASASARRRSRPGIGFITEDRKAEGLALAQSIAGQHDCSPSRTVLSPRKRRGANGAMPIASWPRSPSCARAAPSRRSASSPAATSRRSCSPSGCRRSRRS